MARESSSYFTKNTIISMVGNLSTAYNLTIISLVSPKFYSAPLYDAYSLSLFSCTLPAEIHGRRGIAPHNTKKPRWLQVSVDRQCYYDTLPCLRNEGEIAWGKKGKSRVPTRRDNSESICAPPKQPSSLTLPSCRLATAAHLRARISTRISLPLFPFSSEPCCWLFSPLPFGITDWCHVPTRGGKFKNETVALAR